MVPFYLVTVNIISMTVRNGRFRDGRLRFRVPIKCAYSAVTARGVMMCRVRGRASIVAVYDTIRASFSGRGFVSC